METNNQNQDNDIKTLDQPINPTIGNQPLNPIPSFAPNELVTITRGQLQGILADLDALKNKGILKKPKRVTERTATLRFYQDKPVAWYGNIKEQRDKLTGKLVAYMDIKLLGGVNSITVEYLDFLNSPNRFQVLIKDQKANRIERNLGFFQAENPNPAHDPNTGQLLDKTWKSREIENITERYEYIATVVVQEGPNTGKEYILNTKALNQ